jgi:hypothetical protein
MTGTPKATQFFTLNNLIANNSTQRQEFCIQKLATYLLRLGIYSNKKSNYFDVVLLLNSWLLLLENRVSH